MRTAPTPLTTLAGLVFLLAPAAAGTEARLSRQVVRVPVDLSTGRVVVRVRVDGHGPFRFLLDTGAAVEAAIDRSVAERLRLEPAGTVWNDDGSGHGPRRRSLVRLGSVRAGGFVATDVRALVADYAWLEGPDEPIHGLLGLHAFRDIRLTIDFPGRELRLTRRPLPAARAREGLAPDHSRGVLRIPVRIGGQGLLALLDTGFNGGLSLPAHLRRLVATASEPVPSGVLQTVNNELPVLSAKLEEALVVGAAVHHGVRASFVEGDGLVVLGCRLLREHVVTIDQRVERVLIEAPPNGRGGTST